MQILKIYSEISARLWFLFYTQLECIEKFSVTNCDYKIINEKNVPMEKPIFQDLLMRLPEGMHSPSVVCIVFKKRYNLLYKILCE